MSKVWNPETNEWITREKLLKTDYADRDYDYAIPADPLGVIVRIYRCREDISRKEFESFASKVLKLLKEKYEFATTSEEIEEFDNDLGYHDMLSAIGFHCPPGWPSGMGIRVELAPLPHFGSPTGKVMSKYIFVDPCEALSTEILDKIRKLDRTTEIYFRVSPLMQS